MLDDRTQSIVDAKRVDVANETREKEKVEQIEREKIIMDKTFSHDYKVAIVSSIFSALLGALLSEPLWSFIRAIIAQG